MDSVERPIDMGPESDPGGGVLALRLLMNPLPVATFAPLLQDGFLTAAPAGTSVNSFLEAQVGIAGDFVATRISTIFLDGRPVDDADAAFLRDGSVLALSGAMPGLAGAAMRKGGMYSSLRSGITYEERGGGVPAGGGLIRVKLFNLLIEELGPLFLARGILVPAAEAADLFARQGDLFWQVCADITLEGRRVARSLFSTAAWTAGKEWVELAAITAETG